MQLKTRFFLPPLDSLTQTIIKEAHLKLHLPRFQRALRKTRDKRSEKEELENPQQCYREQRDRPNSMRRETVQDKAPAVQTDPPPHPQGSRGLTTTEPAPPVTRAEGRAPGKAQPLGRHGEVHGTTEHRAHKRAAAEQPPCR